VVSTSVERIRDLRSDFFVTLGRVLIAPAVKIDRLFLAVQAHAIPPPSPFRGNLCRSNTTSHSAEQKNAGVFILTWQVKAMVASRDAQWTPFQVALIIV
jgi:hypothetical protein